MKLRIRRLLGSFLLGLIAAMLSYYGLMLYANRDRDSKFYLVDTELSDPAYLSKLQADGRKEDGLHQSFGFSAHRLKAGHGLVIAHRHYSGGSTAVDDESYDKLTIWLPQGGLPTSKQQLRSPEQAVLVVSVGGSAWPENDCSGYVSGNIVLIPDGDQIEVRVEGKFQPTGNIGLPRHCEPRNESAQFQVSPGIPATLTRWDGGAGGSDPYDETYPP